MSRFCLLILCCAAMGLGISTPTICHRATAQEETHSRQDRLRGSVTPERKWWDLLHYDLAIRIFPDEKTISGSNRISFKTLSAGKRMQVDLQEPLTITRVLFRDQELSFRREGNVYWIEFAEPLKAGTDQVIEVFYQGQPVESKNPPWSGGISWATDSKGHHFVASSCQGIGASVWWPCKDHGYDEPDNGMDIRLTVPDDLVGVSNGRLKKTEHNPQEHVKTFHWQVTNPINSYGVNINVGKYVNFTETYDGEFGELELSYWVLEHQRETAEKHFREAPRTIKAFEHWFGKYPFYEDSYKLVVAPYLGMEHQSSVSYGNGFKNGYRGRDLSGTGVGLKFDFIIVHESGHEWFGNNISMKDTADMWIHESFTNYSETLFVEYHFSKQDASDYVIGCRRNIRNDRPIIADYNVNQSGSGDMYYKGANMLHTIRQIVNNDSKWRTVLKGLNKTFWHQTVTTQQIETYINQHTGIDFSLMFDQYLRTTKIPMLKHKIDGPKLTYWFEDTVDGFRFPIKTKINNEEVWLTAAEDKQTLTHSVPIESFELDRNFYILSQED